MVERGAPAEGETPPRQVARREGLFARLMNLQEGSEDVREHAGTFQNLCELADFKA